MKAYTNKQDKIDNRKCSFGEIRGNEKPRKKAARRIAMTDIISEVTGELECVDCTNEELNGFSSHCKTCGMPIVF